jgi:hypothetical protein
MSETVAVALISASSALGGVLITQLFHWLMQKREQEERYRLAIFDKTLAVHQQAYEWLQRLNLAVHNAQSVATGEQSKQLVDLAEAAGRWWDANCLYLDPESREQFLRFADEIGGHSIGGKPPVFEHWLEAVRAVELGIRREHINTKGFSRDH